MKINAEKNGNELNIALEGRLDTSTAPELEEKLSTELAGVAKLIFNFSKLDYISSAGLRVLLGAKKKIGDVTIRYANDMVMEVFEVTGFTDILTIE